jgi:hypothetical protein
MHGAIQQDDRLMLAIMNTKRERLVLVRADGETVGTMMSPADMVVVFEAIVVSLDDTVELRPTVAELVAYINSDPLHFRHWLEDKRQREAV